MRRILHIALNDCLLFVRDRLFFFWTLVLPLFFVFIFGKAFAGMNQPDPNVLVVVNRDAGPWGRYLVEKLHRTPLEVREAKEDPGGGQKRLLIPADFSEKIVQKKAQELILKTREAARIQAVTEAEVTVMGAVIQLLAEIVVHPDAETFFVARQEFRQLVELESGFPSGAVTTIPSGFDHQVPGTLVNFLLMNLLIAGAVTLLFERKNGMLLRILSSPVSVGELWMGKLVGRLALGLLQAVLLIAAGSLFFSFHLGNIGLAFLIVFGFSLAATSMSLLLGSLITKEEVLIGTSVLTANILAALGGCWWPIEIVSRSMRRVSMLFPTYWAMDGFHKIIFFKKGLAALAPNLLVLLGFSILFSLLSIRFFRIRD